MKKLFAMFMAAVIWLALLPQSSKASPGCLLYWSPLTAFFQEGGSVTVIHSYGSEYQVSAANVVSGAQYGLAAGDSVFVYPPDCHVYYWGWVYFCPCNNQGGVTCGSAQPEEVGGAVFLQLSAWENCNCPNGASAGGLHFVFQKYCQAPPPAPSTRLPILQVPRL